MFEPFEFRIKRPSGEIRYMYILALEKKILREENHAFLFGVTQDITKYKEAEKVIKESLDEKELLIKELYHRTKNNMQVISSMLAMKSLLVDNPAVKELIRDMSSRISAMALVHEKLYKAKDLSKMEIQSYINDLVSSIKKSFQPIIKDIEFQLNIQETYLSIDTAIPCGLIINELLTNCIKHAFPNNQKGRISIELEKNSENQIHLIVKDDGIGIPESIDLDNSTSFGLQAVVGLVEHQMGGKLDLIRENGTTFQIILKDKIQNRI
ncbi:MAG: sensor histidine kinase, partial [Leptospiraceae bacterium]|nr:sensor histidine kinase [Leptospiraceae bacterium]